MCGKLHAVIVRYCMDGMEFAAHEKIAADLNSKSYFATPYHSWERGLNEHTNGLIRQYLQKSFDFKIEEKDPKKPGVDEVLVKVHACGLCGTDMHFARDWTEDYAPLGHEISAEVMEVGEGNIPYKTGDKVIVEDVALCGICENCKSGKTHMCRNMYDMEGQPGMAEMMMRKRCFVIMSPGNIRC